MGAGISSTGVTESGTCDCTAGTPELGDPTLSALVPLILAVAKTKSGAKIIWSKSQLWVWCQMGCLQLKF